MFDPKILPTVNACLNSLAAIFLLCGFCAIKARKDIAHKKFMVAALACSALFLCSYLTYHFLVPGVTRYQGQGILRVIYFTILLTHTPLAAVIVPLCAAAVYQALRKNFEAHKRITRWLFPMWMYVSVTGIIIYLMLYVFS